MTTPQFGRPRRHFRLTGSTNDEARVLAEAGAPSGTVVTAAEQDAGRGRHGRRWSAPAGSALLCSAILRPLGAGHSLLPLAAPLAVCDAIEALAPVRCAVKWPNDVWIDQRKVAGILIEARPPEWAVIGIGINLSVAAGEFPEDLRWPATSVGHGAGSAAALDALTGPLSRWVGADPDGVVEAFASRDALRGREVSWEGVGDQGTGSGVAAGIDARGDLLVRTAGGEEIALGSGEVSLALAN